MLARKMLRDMARHKTQFISIFIMAFLAVFIYAGIGGEWRGLRKNADDFYKVTNLADAWVYGDGIANAELDGANTERRLDLSAEADISGLPRIDLYFVEKGEISKPYILEGAAFDIDDADGIWLFKRFADARSLRIGDRLKLSYNGLSLEKTIRGLAYSPEQVFLYNYPDTLTPDFAACGYAYLSYQAFPLAEIPYSTLLVDGDIEESDIDFDYSVFLTQASQPSVKMFANEVTQHKMMGDIFPIVFALIALLTILTTMTRLVTGQRIQIGTLKALGFKKSVIMRHYIGYGFFLALFGATLGLIVGPLTLPVLFIPSMSGFYTLPVWKPAFDLSFAIASVVIVVTCTLVTYLACKKLLRETPADTLRPKSPKMLRHGLLEHSRLWEKSGFNIQWNIRDASRQRARSAMAIIGVFGCTSLFVCAVGMYESMDELKTWQYEIINKYESKLALSDTITDTELASILNDANGEAIMEGKIEIRANGDTKQGSLLVTDDTTLIQSTGLDRKPVTLPRDGIAMTEKQADMLGLSPGDTFEWHVYGDLSWHEGQVDTLYRDPVSQGITMEREYFEGLGMIFKPTSVLSAEQITGNISGVGSITLTADSIKGWDDMTEAMSIMTYLLIAAAAVLSVVVLYNLGVLSFTEAERELATLKVMGLRSAKLRGLLLTQNLWFSAAGFALGIPGGLLLLELIVHYSGDSFEFPVELTPPTFFSAFAFTFGLSILVNLLFSKKIRRLDLVGTLKTGE